MSDVFLGDLPLWSDLNARAVLETLCIKHGVPMDVLEEPLRLQCHKRVG